MNKNIRPASELNDPTGVAGQAPDWVDEIEQSTQSEWISLKDGESIEVTLDPSIPPKQVMSRFGTPRFEWTVKVGRGGEIRKLSAGKKLTRDLIAMIKLGHYHIKITRYGEGPTDTKYEVMPL